MVFLVQFWGTRTHARERGGQAKGEERVRQAVESRGFGRMTRLSFPIPRLQDITTAENIV